MGILTTAKPRIERKSKRRRYNQPRKPAKPRIVPKDKKKSPNSLRRVLVAVRNSQGPEGTQIARPEFLDLLIAAWIAAGSRYGIDRPSVQIFRATEMGRTPLFYWEIENYAHLVNVPSAVLLLVSRLIEDKLPKPDAARRPNAFIRAEAIVSGIRGLLDAFDKHVAAKSEISDGDIRLLIDAYLAAVHH